jgi:hypothetical protein
MNSEKKLYQEINLIYKIPKFSGKEDKIQLEEFVRQIDNFADIVRWTNYEGGENEEICFLFRRLLKGKANQHWRLMEEEDKFNLKIWENVKSWF